jgi:glycosyltransferase involved in cell wall biosynthesis
MRIASHGRLTALVQRAKKQYFASGDVLVKKLYINGKFFCQRVTGTQRYARELLGQFDKLLSNEYGKKLTIELLVPKNAQSIPKFSNIQVRTVGGVGGTKWEQLDLPRHCRGQLLLTLSGGAPILHSENVVTIHDAAVFAAPSGYSIAYRLWYQNLYRALAQNAKHILTVSNFSKSEIVNWCGADPAKISVSYLGSDHFFNLEADASALSRFGIVGRYVLAASSRNPNKNFGRIVQAIHHLNKITSTQLVVAGGYDNNVFTKGTSLPDGIRDLGYVSDRELKALYQNAECFVFASLYEGFGLPPLEAMSSGCPVVVSRAASLPELFESVAEFCNPNDPVDIASAIQRSLGSRVSSARQLMAFAEQFSWERCARETLEVLDDL